MSPLFSRASAKLALVFFTLMAAATANAMLLDCNMSPGAELLPGAQCNPAEGAVTQVPGYRVKEAIPVVAVRVELPDFQIDQARSPGPVPHSVPLLAFISALFAVLLVRTKRFNTK